jgi:Uma2 family endonuclease
VIEKNLGEVFTAPFDVILDNENVLQPDILFVSKDRQNIIGENNIQGAPDLSIEIISASSAYSDFVKKKQIYARFGVKEFWVVIPEEEAVEIHILKENVFSLQQKYWKKDTLQSPLLGELRLPLSTIF